jgi:hypothetical protein
LWIEHIYKFYFISPSDVAKHDLRRMKIVDTACMQSSTNFLLQKNQTLFEPLLQTAKPQYRALHTNIVKLGKNACSTPLSSGSLLKGLIYNLDLLECFAKASLKKVKESYSWEE